MGMIDYPIFSEQLRKGGVGEQYYLNCPSKNNAVSYTHLTLPTNREV